MLVIEVEEGMIRAVLGNIRTFLIPFLIFVNPLAVHPFIEGTAVIKHAVKNHADAPLMAFRYQLGKHFIGALQILLPRHPLNIARGMSIILVSILQKFTLIPHKMPQMGIDMIIVLNIIFMVGWRYEQRIKINNIDAQALKIVQFFKHSGEIAAVKLADIHRRWPFVPVRHACNALINIGVFIIQHVILRVAVAETINKNLIHDGTFRPVRSMKARADAEGIVIPQILRHTQLIVITVNAPAA